MARVPTPARDTLTLYFAGEAIQAFDGDTVAAALLAAGHRVFRRTPISGSPRGPLCMMGVCFECLVEIDGRGNQQACMQEVRNGMVVELQDGAFDSMNDNSGSMP